MSWFSLAPTAADATPNDVGSPRILFFAFVPPTLIGWFVMSIGTALTIFVLWKWIRPETIGRGILLGVAWCAIAIICDYIFIVMLLDPPDGYYKLDIYIYYVFTLALPVLMAWQLRGRIRG